MKICTAAVAVWLLAQPLASDVAPSLLTHGPVVGGVTASEAKVFIRTSQVAGVLLRYGTDPNLRISSVTETVTTDAASDFTKIIPLTELAAETTYYLDVLVDGVPQFSSPYPFFTTFPPNGSARDFSFVVLTDFTTVTTLTDRVKTFASVAATNPVFAFIGGDFDHGNPERITAKRRMFKDLYNPKTRYMDGFVSQILRKLPIIHQWDDHDSGENNIDKTYAHWDLTQQVFEEYVPSYPLPAAKPGIWQRFSYAQADCFVLDCRSQRDPEGDPDDLNKSMLDGDALGATGELHWLERGLLASPARWKIIFSSVIINPTTKYPDGWAGYQTEWSALREFIRTNFIRGVVFISGDLHLAAIDDGSNAGLPEMCVPQPNGNEFGNCATSGVPGSWSEGYYEDTCTGFGLVTISQNPDQLILQAADQDGNVHLSLTLPQVTRPE